eukprot:TRINITY_DN986_c0_g1_i4.p1 TRINITY_DN986_c0_g1~~TRINITY_DN986_c0_g1_i4.p1  ORF type:complete len:518 (-),score=237.01 TRINITY_DN986_c0_g1_i4:289-1797(-)
MLRSLVGSEMCIRDRYQYKATCDFETSGIKKAKVNAVQWRYDQKVAEREEQLQQRRAKIAALYSQEQEQYECELAGLTKNADERKLDMQQRAEKLKAAREAKRKEQADAAELRRWRDGCDELRAEVAQGIVLECMIDRDLQVKEKEHRFEEEMKAEIMYDRMWEQDRQKKVVRERKDESRRQAIENECCDMIATQIDELAQRRADAEAIKWQEGESMREQFNEQQLVAAQDARERAITQLKERERVAEFNKAVSKERSKLMSLELEDDIRMLNTVLAKEKAEDERDSANKLAQIQGARAYAEEVKQQMIKEASNEAELERLRQDDQEREWRKREEQWAREKAARDHLMREVILERKRQLEFKADKYMQDKSEELLERERLINEMERLATIEEQQAFDRREAKLNNQDVLVTQIKRKQQAEMEAAEQISLQREHQRKVEEEYMRRVNDERMAFQRERERIVAERKAGTGVDLEKTGPAESIQHGRRAGSARSERSAPPFATDE